MKDTLEKLKARLNIYHLVLAGIVAFAAFIRFDNAFFQGMWVDEARYAQTGLDLSKHIFSYSMSWREQITFFQPLFPYLIGFANFIFDSNTAARIVSPLVSLGGVTASYLLGATMKDRKTGIFIAALVAVNPIFWFLSTRILIGALLTTLFTATMVALFYGFEDKEFSRYVLWLVGPLTALTVLSKQPAFTLGLIVPIYVGYAKRDALKSFIIEGKGFEESGLRNVLTDKDLWISGLGGVAVLTPWMIRNLTVCRFPFCGALKALSWGSKSGGLDIQGAFFFIKNLPTVVTLPLTLLIGARVLYYVFDRINEDPDFLVKYFAATGIACAATYFVSMKFLPFVFLTSIAVLARPKSEKLLWLWIGVGIGFMSIPVTKVPRYIVFTVPALLGVASFLIKDVAAWISNKIKVEQVNASRVMLLALIPLLALSFAQGSVMVSGHSFQQLEPAGEWIQENYGNTSIAATSAKQINYFSHPSTAKMPPHNQSEFKNFIEENDIEVVEVDVYERAQPKWIMTRIPPYRLHRQTLGELRSGEKTPQSVVESYGRAPEFLKHVKSFGRTGIPLVRNQVQPQVMVYEVNRSALR